MPKKSKFKIEVITDAPPKVTHEPAHGMGDGATSTVMTGRAIQVTIVRDDRPALVIDINDKGNVYLTNCEGMFEHLYGAVVQFKNTRPWA